MQCPTSLIIAYSDLPVRIIRFQILTLELTIYKLIN